MLFMQGRWYSSHDRIKAAFGALPLLFLFQAMYTHASNTRLSELL